MKKEEQVEEEVITFKEFAEKHKNIKEEELHKIVLVCKNCGHKDLLKNFLKERARRIISPWSGNIVKPTPISPIRFKPRWTDNSITSKQAGQLGNPSKTTKMMMTTLITPSNYEDMFYCPKCGSSLVVLCKEFIKNNVARLL